MWELQFTVTRKAWMNDPRIRWNAGLERAGINFRQGLQRSHYPPIDVSGSVYNSVAGMFGGDAGALSGGPRYVRTYQTADRAGARIVSFGEIMEFGSTWYLNFILSGTVKWEGWPGKADELAELMRRGFASGIRDYSE